MSKLNYAKLSQAFQAIKTLTEQDKSKAYVFPSALRIKMGGNFRRLRDLLVEIETEQSQLFNTYGTPMTEPGKEGQFQVMKTSDKWLEFEAAYKALQAEEFEVALTPMTDVELINSRVVKSRNDKGQVSENTEENQIPLDLIADLQSTGLLPTGDPETT